MRRFVLPVIAAPTLATASPDGTETASIENTSTMVPPQQIIPS